jgi:predicted DNA-binding ribbon-helix-helix protein
MTSSARSSDAASDKLIQTSFRLPRARWAKLQQLGIEERMSIQSIIVAALEAEFQRRGMKF